MRRGTIDWEAVGGILAGLVVVAAVVVAVVWAVNQPTCYGIEPDGEVEQLWPCPAPHTDGERFPIAEDEFEDREMD